MNSLLDCISGHSQNESTILYKVLNTWRWTNLNEVCVMDYVEVVDVDSVAVPNYCDVYNAYVKFQFTSDDLYLR